MVCKFTSFSETGRISSAYSRIDTISPSILTLVQLVKSNTLILYSYFHRMFMFLFLMSVTFYQYTELEQVPGGSRITPAAVIS